MYLTSFIHRNTLLEIAERWFLGKPDPADGLALTGIFICDGYVVGETLASIAERLIGRMYPHGFNRIRIRCKGELRDALCRCRRGVSPRVEYLKRLYRDNPDYFYYEAPINGVLCIDDEAQMVGTYRIKRPKRIAEKANRRIAAWIFKMVQDRARRMAEVRARNFGVPLEDLLTPEPEMVREFVNAEAMIAGSFREGRVRFDRSAITINDVGGIKILGNEEDLAVLETDLSNDSAFRLVEREDFHGDYEAVSMVLDVEWDPEAMCRKFRDTGSWKNYLGRGIPESELKKGLEPLLAGAEPRIRIELILSTFEHMVESELGNSIHEERIVSQRDTKIYKGFIPINVEFLLEYLFAVGFSPGVNSETVPIRIWGRYLPDTLGMFIRRLYRLPEYDLFY